MPGGADGDGPGLVLAGDPELLGPDAQRLAPRADPDRVVDDVLEVEVLDVRVARRQPPGGRGVAPDDDAGQAGDREAGDVEGAPRADRGAVQPDLGERGRDRGVEVRIVREHRQPVRRVRTAHHPGVGPEPLSRPEQPGERGPGAVGTRHRALRARWQDRPAGSTVGAAGRARSGVEGLAHDRAAGDDRGVPVQGVAGRQVVGPLRAHGGHGPGVVDLVVQVGAQLPPEHLQHRERVHRGPLLGRGVDALEVEQRVLQRDLAGGPPAQVGVHARGVRVEVAPGRGRLQRELGLGRAPEADGADEGVRLDLGGAEKLREAPGGGVPAYVHLVEAVRGGEVALRLEEVLRLVGVDLRHPVSLADHRHPAPQPGQRRLAVELRQRAPDRRRGQAQEPRAQQHDHHHGEDQPAGDVRHAGDYGRPACRSPRSAPARPTPGPRDDHVPLPGDARESLSSRYP